MEREDFVLTVEQAAPVLLSLLQTPEPVAHEVGSGVRVFFWCSFRAIMVVSNRWPIGRTPTDVTKGFANIT